MNEELYNRVRGIFEQVEGGVTADMNQMIEEAIEDGTITDEEFQINEYYICALFDNFWFTCATCGWTMPIEEQSEVETADLNCSECVPTEEEE